MRKLLLLCLLFSGCANYWHKTGTENTEPRQPTIFTDAPCGNPKAQDCWNPVMVRVEINVRWKDDAWMVSCLEGHADKGKYSHGKGWSHEQWQPLPNGLIRPNCGDEA